jgi:hypothetical protein
MLVGARDGVVIGVEGEKQVCRQAKIEHPGIKKRWTNSLENTRVLQRVLKYRLLHCGED